MRLYAPTWEALLDARHRNIGREIARPRISMAPRSRSTARGDSNILLGWRLTCGIWPEDPVAHCAIDGTTDGVMQRRSMCGINVSEFESTPMLASTIASINLAQARSTPARASLLHVGNSLVPHRTIWIRSRYQRAPRESGSREPDRPFNRSSKRRQVQLTPVRIPCDVGAFTVHAIAKERLAVRECSRL